MKMLKQVALLSQSPSVSLSEVVKVSAALQKQAMRDFAPIWDTGATVDAFESLSDVPLGYWPVIVRDDVSQQFSGAGGIHLDESGQPFALVQSASDWSLTASHEVLEMIADPFGDRLVAGRAPDAPKAAKDQKRVEYLVEVCDPSEDAQHAYTVNDILVSDFYTPDFFDPVPASGVRYSFTGALRGPRRILKNGYLSWHNPVDDHWYQLRWFGTPSPVVTDLGVFGTSSMSTREWIDHQTVTPAMKKMRSPKPGSGKRLMALTASSGTASGAAGRAARIEAQIARLLSGA